MSNVRAANAIISNKAYGGIFKRYRKVQRVTGTTGGAAVIGVLYVDATTAGLTAGQVHLAIDTSGTGSRIGV